MKFNPRWFLAGLGALLITGGAMTTASTHHNHGSPHDYVPSVGITVVGFVILVGSRSLKNDD